MSEERPGHWKSECMAIDARIEIPATAWYGLYLYFESKDVKDENQEKDASHSAGDSPYSLKIETQGSGEININLPFREQGVPLLSLSFGKAIYLEEKWMLSVSQKREESAQKDLQWKLVRHRLVPKDYEYPSQKTAELILSDDLRKRFICGFCSRGFAEIQGVTQHLSQVHSEKPKADTIWTTPLKVLYSDNFLAVLDKPQGVAVQGDSKSLLRSDLLLALANPPNTKITWPDNRNDKVMMKPVPVHRLDAPTGGILVVAKTKASERCLRMAFAERTTKKRYRALLYGNLKEDQGDITHPVSKKPSETRFQVVKRIRSVDFGWFTLVDFVPITGRQHQLRKHAQHLGHSICGDKRYTRPGLTPKQLASRPCSRLCLWAVELSIPHPVSNEMRTFSLPPVEWLESTIELEERAWREQKCS